MKRVALVLLAALTFTAAFAAAYAWQAYRQLAEEPLIPMGGEPAKLKIERGTRFATVAQTLVDRGHLKSPWPLRLYARYTGQAQRIQAGEYALTPGITARGLLAQLTRGEVVQHQLTIVEGWTARELFDAVAAHDALEPTLPLEDPQAVMAALDHPDQHPEGRFLPETYRFPRGTTDRAFLARAYHAMARALQAEWAERSDELPLDTPKDALILASIIEKETAVAAERDRIAGVFVRRLRRGMRLQTDPTVIYGIGEGFDGNLRRADLRRDTPYNTYTRSGLPPTPIALPGRASLHAALHPAAGDALYFVATGNGGHAFSATLEAHNRAVRKYQLGQDE